MTFKIKYSYKAYLFHQINLVLNLYSYKQILLMVNFCHIFFLFNHGKTEQYRNLIKIKFYVYVFFTLTRVYPKC